MLDVIRVKKKAVLGLSRGLSSSQSWLSVTEASPLQPPQNGGNTCQGRNMAMLAWGNQLALRTQP